MATYYVRADGSATKANATGPAADPSKCMSLATWLESAFAPADVVVFSELGGDFTAPVIHKAAAPLRCGESYRGNAAARPGKGKPGAKIASCSVVTPAGEVYALAIEASRDAAGRWSNCAMNITDARGGH